MERIWNSLYQFREAIHDINVKYKEPRVKMTPMVAFWLLMLRFYLIGMLVLLAFKFVSLVSGGFGGVP